MSYYYDHSTIIQTRKKLRNPHKRTILAIGFLSTFLPSFPACSEPDANAEYVLNEPLTLMDFGLYKAETILDRSLDSYRHRTGMLILTYANYDPESNRIHFSISLPGQKFSESQCEELIQEVRKGGALTNGKLLDGLTHSLYAHGFKHKGLSAPGASDRYLAGLDQITKIRVIGETKCSGPLVGSRFDTRHK
ncbi:hypothetical protein [Nisaea sp.]|uniref:hypothetical protein n=1 Tax=Nisaea sp. TaxID=2024842 RepID=UPI003296A76B